MPYLTWNELLRHLNVLRDKNGYVCHAGPICTAWQSPTSQSSNRRQSSRRLRRSSSPMRRTLLRRRQRLPG
mgnify:CR=1 FL=1